MDGVLMALVSSSDVDLDVSTGIAGSDPHFLVAHQKVDLLRHHCVNADKHIGIKTVNNVKFTSQDGFDGLACLELCAWDPDHCNHIFRC